MLSALFVRVRLTKRTVTAIIMIETTCLKGGSIVAYLCKDEATRNAIRDYINEYTREHLSSPSIREIAAGTGISRAMVQRYMAAMREEGELEYGRRDVCTSFTRGLDREQVLAVRLGTVSCGIPKEPFPDAAECITFPRSLVGEGLFYVVEADGDSMVDVGIEDGDLVIVRRQSDAADGEIAVVLIDGSETTLKRFYRLPDRAAYRLHAENRTYPGEERDRIVTNAEIQGVAVKVLKDLK